LEKKKAWGRNRGGRFSLRLRKKALGERSRKERVDSPDGKLESGGSSGKNAVTTAAKRWEGLKVEMQR